MDPLKMYFLLKMETKGPFPIAMLVYQRVIIGNHLKVFIPRCKVACPCQVPGQPLSCKKFSENACRGERRLSTNWGFTTTSSNSLVFFGCVPGFLVPPPCKKYYIRRGSGVKTYKKTTIYKTNQFPNKNKRRCTFFFHIFFVFSRHPCQWTFHPQKKNTALTKQIASKFFLVKNPAIPGHQWDLFFDSFEFSVVRIRRIPPACCSTKPFSWQTMRSTNYWRPHHLTIWSKFEEGHRIDGNAFWIYFFWNGFWVGM